MNIYLGQAGPPESKRNLERGPRKQDARQDGKREERKGEEEGEEAQGDAGEPGGHCEETAESLYQEL